MPPDHHRQAAETPPTLIGGPYLPPLVRRGDWLDDEIVGLVQVGGNTDALIPWPYRLKPGKMSLILCGDLVEAVLIESESAICHHWGVGVVTVWKWRKALGVDRVTEGTRRLLQEKTGVPPEAAALGRERARSPEARAKMSASHTGKPAHPNIRANLLKWAKASKPPGWGKRANQWMLEGKRNKQN